MTNCSDICIVVPAYNRVSELEELFNSVLNQVAPPGELLVIEDNSPKRTEISTLCSSYADLFAALEINFIYLENEANLGFDKNLRKCLEISEKKWALVLGNDDLLLPNAIRSIVNFVGCNDVDVISRSFVRFNTDINKPLGISSLSPFDRIYNSKNSSPKMLFRTTAFIGGLVFNVDFCRKLHTEQYDGTLYYQIYLAAAAFCNKGIGYISEAIVGGRSDNPPMFGSSANEKSVHIPGGYTAAGRAHMWRGVLEIVLDAQIKYKIELFLSVKRELEVRQSFHVFEMNAGANYKTLRLLKHELARIGLFSHPIPHLFYFINRVFGFKSKYFYLLIRRFFQ